MTAFRRLRFGVGPFDFTEAQVINAERFLISYVRSCQQISVLIEVGPTLEVFQLAKAYIGQNFKQWLEANYNNGSGVRAGLCRAIAAWHHQKLSDKGLIGEVKRDISRLAFINDIYGQLPQPEVFSADPASCETQPQITTFDGITDKTFFELLALLGPELVAHLCLSLNGVKALN